MRGPTSTSKRGDAAVAPLSTTPPAAPSCDDDDDDECPVCYRPFASMAPARVPARVVCKVCKHAVCAGCNQMLTMAGHEKCPMCRAPRPSFTAQMLSHAFRCRDSACEIPHCAEAKPLLLRMEVHAQICPKRGLTGADECKVCKLWKALHRTPAAA